MIDHLVGAESASGLLFEIACPSCLAKHRVVVSTLGRFAFTCGVNDMNGSIDEETWKRLRAEGHGGKNVSTAGHSVSNSEEQKET